MTVIEAKERKRDWLIMAPHRILRSILSDDGVIRKSEEGKSSHAQFIHGMCTKPDSLTGEGSHLVQVQTHNNGNLMPLGENGSWSRCTVYIPDFERC